MEFVTISEDNYKYVAKIYEEGIKTGVATFETSVPPWKAWDASHFPFSRIALLNKNQMLGWAALSPVSIRKVYCGVAEVTVYVTKNERAKGFGTRLLNALIAQSEKNNIWTLQSSIMELNQASLKMHLSSGFREIGYREKIGNLNGKWLNNIILERRSQRIGL
ncbi:MAG: GNAT family N-acetyltransferase [Winogradskyella sp.]|nr:GNAT family N-acetyltransferase [Winogradskyella sp.]